MERIVERESLKASELLLTNGAAQADVLARLKVASQEKRKECAAGAQGELRFDPNPRWIRCEVSDTLYVMAESHPLPSPVLHTLAFSQLQDALDRGDAALAAPAPPPRHRRPPRARRRVREAVDEAAPGLGALISLHDVCEDV